MYLNSEPLNEPGQNIVSTGPNNRDPLLSERDEKQINNWIVAGKKRKYDARLFYQFYFFSFSETVYGVSIRKNDDRPVHTSNAVHTTTGNTALCINSCNIDNF